jgi:molecular chaperone GrpE
MSTDDPRPVNPADLLRAIDLAAALEEKETAHRSETERLLLAMGEVLDSLNRLLAVAPDSAVPRRGVQLVARQFETVLADAGLTPLGRVDEIADPSQHCVVGLEHTGQHERGVVAAVVRQGYALGGRVLRPAQVIVESNPDEEPQ